MASAGKHAACHLHNGRFMMYTGCLSRHSPLGKLVWREWPHFLIFRRAHEETTSNHRRWPKLGSGKTGGEETRGYGRLCGLLLLRGCVFPLLHPECHRCARRFGALCAPEALAGVSKGLETPFLGIRHCESCVRVSVDEGIALSHETFTCACPDCPQHERLTFCAAGVVLSQHIFRGAAPLHTAEWQ